MADRGRPTIESKKQTITLNLTPAQMEWLEQIKAAEGKSFGEIIDGLIERKAKNG